VFRLLYEHPLGKVTFSTRICQSRLHTVNLEHNLYCQRIWKCRVSSVKGFYLKLICTALPVYYSFRSSLNFEKGTYTIFQYFLDVFNKNNTAFMSTAQYCIFSWHLLAILKWFQILKFLFDKCILFLQIINCWPEMAISGILDR
jgi:hypothetical protein